MSKTTDNKRPAPGRPKGSGVKPPEEKKKNATIKIYPDDRQMLAERGITLQKLVDAAIAVERGKNTPNLK